MTASSPSVEISLVIELVKFTPEHRDKEKLWHQRVRENPQAWSSHTEILGIEVPKFVMAVAPGRDFALMVETAVKKCLLAQRGVDDEGVFLDAIDRIAAGRRGEVE
jgi:serine kinase of HPr protein (carbohydrate metabolism regulator)